MAAVCQAAGIPFLAVRAVSDTVQTSLSAELIGLLGQGEVTPLRACRALLHKPALIREFLRLARDTRVAARNLANELTAIVNPLN